MGSPNDASRNVRESDFGSDCFVAIKRLGNDQKQCMDAIRSFSMSVTEEMRKRDGAFSDDRLDIHAGMDGDVEHMLQQILLQVCKRSEAVTVVIEAEHVDAVYKDLHATVYDREFFDVCRRTVRLSIFACEIDEGDFFNRPGRIEDWERVQPRCDQDGNPYPPLQKDYVGSIVVVPRCGGVIGRTLLDPTWIAPSDLCVRLTDFDLTIRGKRLKAKAFPWRAQDGEVLSCAETTILAIACYFSNEYNEYPITMPTAMLDKLEETSAERVTPSQGLDYDAVGRVLTCVGFKPRRYTLEGMRGGTALGESSDELDRLRRVTRIYVDSGIPVAINVQPENDRIGHSLVAIGLEENHRPDSWDTALANAERIKGFCGTLHMMDVADLESSRRFCVCDDGQLPYSCARWVAPTKWVDMAPREIVVPTAPQMSLGALDARDMAKAILRSKKAGLLARSDVFADKQLVLIQQMVSVKSYLRYRVATCDIELGSIWEVSPFPRYAWLFECVELNEWNWSRITGKVPKAVVELLLDATSGIRDNPMNNIVLYRYPGHLYYHGPDGADLLFDNGIGYDFPCYDRNLRYVEVRKALVEY